MNKVFIKTLKAFLWGFLSPPRQTHLNFFTKTGIHHFSCFMMLNFMGKKIEKIGDPEILHYRQMEKQIRPN